MKSFFGVTESGHVSDVYRPEALSQVAPAAPARRPSTHSRARIAIYDSPSAAPRVEEVSSQDTRDYIEQLASKVYGYSQECGGDVPYTVIRELAENFIHADFAEPVVSILDSGRTIRFADQGPGITDADRAVRPGFTTASADMKHYIRGVGSGLPIVREFLSVTGGSLSIEDNLGCGAVVTISLVDELPASALSTASAGRSAPRPRAEATAGSSSGFTRSLLDDEPAFRLSNRQTQVLALVMESGSAGPSLVAAELGVGVSTAYRDLASLEEIGLIEPLEGGKRKLSASGQYYLDSLTS